MGNHGHAAKIVTGLLKDPSAVCHVYRAGFGAGASSYFRGGLKPSNCVNCC